MEDKSDLQETKAMPSLKGARRKATNTSLIKTTLLVPSEAPTYLLVEPAVPDVDLADWGANHEELLDKLLLDHGAILFRGFPVHELEDFERFARGAHRTLNEYKNGSTPRTKVGGNVYTTTEFPAHRHIPMHNEMSYSRSWPLRLYLHCMIPAEAGGETPLADSVRVYRQISPKTRDKFAEKGVLYVRNFGEGFDVPWQKAFETDDKAEVEHICKETGVEVEWLENDRLRTRQVAQGVAPHWQTGEPILMNQAHLFNIRTLGAEERKGLLDNFKKEDLPRNSYYGDGTEIEDEVIDEINRIYDKNTVAFQWLKGDVALVDNMRCTHARNPFTGKRRIVIAMTGNHGI